MDYDEYYMELYHGGRFVNEPSFRYEGGALVTVRKDSDTISYFELKRIVKDELNKNMDCVYFYNPKTGSFQNGIRLIWDAKSTIEMLKVCI
jgi:hypothetical protein